MTKIRRFMLPFFLNFPENFPKHQPLIPIHYNIAHMSCQTGIPMFMADSPLQEKDVVLN